MLHFSNLRQRIVLALEEVELMQLTGFQDSAKKDIWECDRVADIEWSGRAGEVKWCAESGTWEIKFDDGGWFNLVEEAEYIRVTCSGFSLMLQSER